MKKNQLLLIIILLIYIPLTAQINKNGIPLIKNYTPNDYNASEQNWAICEDKRGVIYVGNTDDGILEFDGSKWNKIPISNGSIVRSLTFSEGTVYVGGVEEFGYLAPDLKGKMKYHTLTNQLDSVDFKDVWKVYVVNDKVYFCCDEIIYSFKNKKLHKVYRNVDGSFLSFKIFDEIYWGNFYNGPYKLTEDSVVLLNGAEFYKDKDIFLMLPWSNDELFVATINEGIYIYNKETGLSKTLKSLGKEYHKLYNLLNESQIYNGIKLSNGNYALATLNKGCIIFNQNGSIIYKLDKENGLQDMIVINLYETKEGNLWVALNKGISYIELSAPFTRLGLDYGLEGIVTDVMRYNGVLFVSTNIGVYYLDYNAEGLPHFVNIPIDNRTVWKMIVFDIPNSTKSKLLFSTNYYVREYIEGREPKVLQQTKYKEPYDSRVLYQSRFDKGKLYIGSYGLGLFEYKEGEWIDQGRFNQNEIPDEIRTITEDINENLWLGTSLKGIIRVKKDSSIKRYGVEEGLPDLKDNRVYFYDDKIICATNKGVYYYDEESDQFNKYSGFGERYLVGNDNINFISIKNEEEVWIVGTNPNTNSEYIDKLRISQDRIVSVEDVPFRRLSKNSFYDIEFDGENGTWIATSDAIYNYQEKFKDEFTQYYNSLIRKVELGIDSVLFFGTYYDDTSNLVVDLSQPEHLKEIIDFKHNSFNFYFSTPYIPTEQVEYSYKLEGFDKNWSNWNSETDNKYTNLSNGHYTFMVKAKNIYGIESEIVKYEFTIKPPWYKTAVAFIFYFILAIVVIIVIVKIYTRRLELEKIRLEQIVKERTEEVVKQKDEIADKNRSITDSIEYASRIQTAVLPSDDFAEEILPEHFILFRPRDIVSGDFYWMTKKDNQLIVIAADCTGHGVPGAFMSMLGVSFLNEIVNRHEVISAGAILTQLRSDVKKTLGQEGKEGEAKDGMDIALCIVDLEKMKMQYAGAYNPLYLYRNNELIEVKADRMPIGIYIKEKESFTNNEIDLQKDDVFYIFSDGFQDQFGGEDGSKFKTKNFKKLLLEIHQKPMDEQRKILDTTVDEWRGKWEQVDDIIVLGVRV